MMVTFPRLCSINPAFTSELHGNRDACALVAEHHCKKLMRQAEIRLTGRDHARSIASGSIAARYDAADYMQYAGQVRSSRNAHNPASTGERLCHFPSRASGHRARCEGPFLEFARSSLRIGLSMPTSGSRLVTPSMPMAPISTVRPSSRVLKMQTSPRLMKWMCLVGWSTQSSSLSPDQTYWFRNPQYPVQCRRRQRKQKAIVDPPAFVKRSYDRPHHGANTLAKIAHGRRCKILSPECKRSRERPQL